MNNKKFLWTIIPFTIILFGVFLLNLLSIDRPQSEAENRILSQRPGMEEIESKEFSKLYEDYYTDQFLGRDALLQFYTKLQINLNKSEVRDHYIIDNTWILPKPISKLTDDKLEEAVSKINTLSNKLSESDKDVFFSMNPSKGISLDHLYPKHVNNDGEIENPRNFIDSMNNTYINTIDVDKYFIENFNNQYREELFFKTDHHWNGLGAYEGFKFIISEMNKYNPDKYPVKIQDDDYSVYSPSDKNFLGSYNRNFFSIFDMNDTIQYHYNINNKHNDFTYLSHNGTSSMEINSDTIIATESYSDTFTYAGLYTYDHPLYTVVNENAPIKQNLLIFRDSYQAPTTTLFADLFESVTIVDPRHIDSIGLSCSDVMNSDDIDTVMFMFNSQNFEGMIKLIN